MIEEGLPDIPRLYTALAEWGACVVYVLLARRRPSRLAIWTLALGLPLLVAVQLFAGGLAIALWIPGMLLAAATMYGIIQLSLQRSWQTGLYLTACAFVLAELLASFQWQIRSYLTREPFLGDARDIVLLVAVFVLGLAAAFWVERNHFPRELRFEADLRHALTAIAIAAVTVFVSNLSFITTNSPFSASAGAGLEIFYIRTLVDLAGFVALYAHQGSRMELQRTHELEAMNSLVRSQHQQYLQTRRTMDEINSRYHDLKHYIAAIRAEPDPQLRADYLNQLEASVQEYDQHIDTGNPVLDAILTQGAQRCSAEGITLTCVADGEAVAFLDAISLSSLVSNALDNAIEAVLRISDPERRLIRVAIYRQDGFAVLRFENYFEGEVTFAGDLPVTSKVDGRNHGFGTRNMRRVADTWSGSLTMEAEDGWFVVRALIPVSASAGSAR
ncbi:GHKL domain-containing protein [Salana multivorans]